MRAKPKMFIRFALLVVCLALSTTTPASAIYKAPTDCRAAYESLNWPEVKQTKMVTRMLGFFEYWKGPQVYRFFDFEEKEAPHGEHGKIGWHVYHLEYDPLIAVWCGGLQK